MPAIRPSSVRDHALVSAIAAAMLVGSPGADAASVADIVQKYGLTGTWATDCAKPPGRENPHVVYQLLDAERLQREIKIVPDQNLDVSVALSIVETGPGEITMTWKTGEGGITNRVRAEPRQMQVLESTRDNGEKISANGRRIRDNAETLIFRKCARPAA